MKTVRTMLYGDCEFFEWELELLHTPIMQRMYNIKQLGFTDKVFPDAIHSRFNHILGVTSRAEKIIRGILRSLKNELKGTLPSRKNFEYNKTQISINELIGYTKNRKQVIRLIALLHDIGHIPFGHTLEDELKVFKISHDEPGRQLKFFNILIREFLYAIILGHDPDPEKKLLDIVINNEPTAEDDLLLINNFIITTERIKERYGNTNAASYADFLFDIETSMIALFYLDDLHKDRIHETSFKEKRDEAISELLISKVIEKCGIVRSDNHKPFDPYLDAFTLDVIGNTICADLLDYAKRDCKQAGLLYDYDDRIFKYFTLVSNIRKEDNLPYIQLALQVFTNKLRSDVVSEIITILRTRYLLSERMLYHPTKCSAGAMLGCAVYMMGIDRAELDFFRMGDAVFLKKLESHSESLHKIINEIILKYNSIEKKGGPEFDELLTQSKVNLYTEGNSSTISKFLTEKSEYFRHLANKQDLARAFQKILAEESEIVLNSIKSGLFPNSTDGQKLISRAEDRIFAAKKMVWQIQSRQYYKKIFRIAKIGDGTTNQIKKDLADKFKQAQFRYNFERGIEQESGLPYGTVVIHCPKFDTAMKQANVLVFGTDPKKVVAFKDINDENDELTSLGDYVQEAKALQTSYLSIWNMYFYVQQAQMHRWPLVEIVIRKQLNELIKSNPQKILNSIDLINQLRREYAEPAKKISSVIEYIESAKCNPKPEINLAFVEFMDTEKYSGKKEVGDFTPDVIVNEWNKRLSNGSSGKK